MDLTALSTEQLLALKAQLDGLTDTSGRSPIRPRQLHDLTLLPTKDDPRPTFFWSAEKPRNSPDLTKTMPYPRLMWHGTSGQEVTVADAKVEATYTSNGYILTPPANAEAPDAAAAMRAQLEQLSPEDRKLLVQAVQKDKMERLKAQMADLTDEEMAALLASVEPAKQRRAG